MGGRAKAGEPSPDGRALYLESERRPWRHKAACLGAPPEWFVVSSGRWVDGRGLAFCEDCRVKYSCLVTANERDQFVIRGGLVWKSEQQRWVRPEAKDIRVNGPSTPESRAAYAVRYRAKRKAEEAQHE
jgi:hypothetical protein